MAEESNIPAVPNLQPRKFVCGFCKIQYPMGKETTLYIYRKQAWFNHLVTNCVKCHREFTVWYLKPAEAQYMSVHNMGEPKDLLNWRMYDYCDDMKVIREFCLDNKKPLPKDYWLSPRTLRHIDNEVAWFAYLLNHGEIERNFDVG